MSRLVFDDSKALAARNLHAPSLFTQRARAAVAASALSSEYLRSYKSPSLVGFSNVLTNMPTTSSVRLSPPTAGSAGGSSGRLPLLPYAQLMLPPSEETKVLAPDSYLLLNSCGFKVVQGTFLGAFVGVAMGLFMSAMGAGESALQVVQGREVPAAPVKEQMRQSFKAIASKTKGMALTFAVLTGLFEGSECVVERYRSKHDVWNQVISGCFSGAAMSAKAGPAAACFGCVGFASFSLVVDKIMGPH